MFPLKGVRGSLWFHYDINDTLGNSDCFYYLLTFQILLCFGSGSGKLHHLVGVNSEIMGELLTDFFSREWPG